MRSHVQKSNPKFYFISSIWDYDSIHRLDENNCQCLWYNKTSQRINYTKVLVHVPVKKGMYIKIYHASMEKSCITRYQELHNFKSFWKGFI